MKIPNIKDLSLLSSFDVKENGTYHTEEELKEHPSWQVSNYPAYIFTCYRCNTQIPFMDDPNSNTDEKKLKLHLEIHKAKDFLVQFDK